MLCKISFESLGKLTPGQQDAPTVGRDPDVLHVVLLERAIETPPVRAIPEGGDFQGKVRHVRHGVPGGARPRPDSLFAEAQTLHDDTRAAAHSAAVGVKALGQQDAASDE